MVYGKKNISDDFMAKKWFHDEKKVKTFVTM